VRATLCSHFVLDNNPNLSYTVAQDLLLTRGALARRRSVGAGTVPCACRTQVRVTGGPGCIPLTRDWVEAAADLAVTASGGHRTGTACPPKRAVREAASRLFHHPHASSSRAAVRATLDRTKARSPKGSGPTGAGWLPSPDQHLRRHGRTGSGHPRRAARVVEGVDPRIKSGDDGEGAGIAAVEIPDRTTSEAPETLSPLWGRVGEGV
jgi:hypothetical protein